MALTIGITGRHQAGKSTLFTALTAMPGASTGSRRVPLARVPIPDERLGRLSRIFRPRKTTPATVDFLDMPGGSEGELGRRTLGEIRSATALVEVVRCFPHPYLEGIDPRGDMEQFETELLLADLAVVEGKLQRGRKLPLEERELLERLRESLAAGDPARVPCPSEEDRKILSGLGLLCFKPRLYAANVPEEGAPERARQVHEFARRRGAPSLECCARLEAEIAELPEEERAPFLKAMGIRESGLSRLVRTSFQHLGLITFFTGGDEEVRAWTVPDGATARQAAGTIHTDMERGFIRAEVIDWAAFVECGSLAAARQRGLLRVEGKDYRVQDGEVLNVLFNV